MDIVTENKILKQILGAIIDIDIGIYPKAFVDKYDERTEHMNGWNAGAIEHCEEIGRVLSDLGVDVEDGDHCLDEPEIIIK